MKRILFCAILPLVGCATSGPAPVAAAPTVTIRIPVPVPCVSRNEIPQVPRTVLNPAGDVKQLAAGAAADIEALQDYAERADAVLRQCAK